MKWFIEFDENTLRPFLIRKYNIDNIVAADALDDVMRRKLDEDNGDELAVSQRMMEVIAM